MKVEEITCGELRITSLQLAVGRFRPRLAASGDEIRAPEEDDAGLAPIGFSLVVVQHDETVIVVDPGLDDPDSRAGARFRATFDVVRSASVDEALAVVGVSSDDVSHVLLTHAHLDHVAGATRGEPGLLMPRFGRATYHLGAADRNGARYDGRPEPEVEARLAALDGRGQLVAAGSAPIAPGVELVGAPGESPGHHVVRIRSQGQTCLLLGDVCHLPSEIEHPEWIPRGRDAASLRHTRSQVLVTAARPGTACHLHHGADHGFGIVTQHGDRFAWRWGAGA